MFFTCVALHNIIRLWERGGDWQAGVHFVPGPEPPHADDEEDVVVQEDDALLADDERDDVQDDNDDVQVPGPPDHGQPGHAPEDYVVAQAVLAPPAPDMRAALHPQQPEMFYEDDLPPSGPEQYWLRPKRRVRSTLVDVRDDDDFAGLGNLRVFRRDQQPPVSRRDRGTQAMVELQVETEAGFLKLQRELIAHFAFRRKCEEEHQRQANQNRPGGVRWLRSLEPRLA